MRRYTSPRLPYLTLSRIILVSLCVCDYIGRSVLRSVVGSRRWCRSVHGRCGGGDRHSLYDPCAGGRLRRRALSRLSSQAALPLQPRRPLLVGRRHAVQAAGRRAPVAQARRPEHVRPRSRPTADVAGAGRSLRRRADDRAGAAPQGLQPSEVRRRAGTETEQSIRRRRRTRGRGRRNATTAASPSPIYQTVAAPLPTSRRRRTRVTPFMLPVVMWPFDAWLAPIGD